MTQDRKLGRNRIRIGIVDPDTSHARAFVTELQRQPKFEFSGIYTNSRVRDPKRVSAFAEEFSIPLRSSMHDLLEHADCGMVLSADWNMHTVHAMGFLSLGKRCFLDKPVCGSLADAVMLGTSPLIAGGSALPFHAVALEASSALQTRKADVIITGPMSGFFMAVHMMELVAMITGGILPERIVEDANGTTMYFEEHTVTLRDAAAPWKIDFPSVSDLPTLTIESDGIYSNLLGAMGAFFRGNAIPSYYANGLMLEFMWRDISDSDYIDSAEFVRTYREEHYDLPL